VVDDFLSGSLKKPGDHVFAGRGYDRCLTVRQYVGSSWSGSVSVGLDPSLFGTHSLVVGSVACVAFGSDFAGVRAASLVVSSMVTRPKGLALPAPS
jgi:hypothetical protein